MHFPDELRYRYAFTTMDEIGNGDIKHGLTNPFRAYSRPAFVLLSMIPASLQRLYDANVGKGNVEYDDLVTYIIPSGFNLAVSMGIIVLFYLILYRITYSRFIALSGMAVYSMLNSSFMELRHMTPYYYGEFIFFLLLYQVLIEPEGKWPLRTLVYYGLMSGIGFTVYPGYFNLAFLIAGLTAFLNKLNLRAIAIYGVSFMAVLLAFELVSQFAGLSYLFDPRQLKCVYDALPTDPSTPRDIIWIVTYMLGIEGAAGGIIMALGLVFLFRYVSDKRTDYKIRVSALLMIIVYIFMVAMIYLKGKFTLRVKYCYPYIFLLTLAAFFVLNNLKGRKAIAVGGLTALAFAQFVFYYIRYEEAVYPRDIRQEYREKYPGKKLIHTAEYYLPSMQRAALAIARQEGFDFVGVNVSAVGGPWADQYNPVVIPDGTEILNMPHPECVYRPYASHALNFSTGGDRYPMRMYKMR
ncbi:MAG: hypothetical protein PHS37_05805 [Candidatus Omnitrophica bacterium]|nr:hypothetical protein [Candidatus Omnitrophota bacterium]